MKVSMNVVEIVLSWVEIVITLAIISVIFLAFMYYSIPFVEERIPKFVALARFTAVFLSVLSLFTGKIYGKLTCIVTFFTNLCWISVVTRGFPFISLLSLDLLLATVGACASHVCWMFSFTKVMSGGWTAIAYYFLFIWGLPIIVAVSLSVTDEYIAGPSGSGRKRKPKSVWARMMSRIITWKGKEE
jgi:hypothetical protein